MQHSSSVNHCPFNCKADYHLTNNQESINLYYPVKRKQALLGSNLSGIAGAEKSQEDGTRSSDRVPTHHFGQYLRKPKKLSAILGLDRIPLKLHTLVSCQLCIGIVITTEVGMTRGVWRHKYLDVTLAVIFRLKG